MIMMLITILMIIKRLNDITSVHKEMLFYQESQTFQDDESSLLDF